MSDLNKKEIVHFILSGKKEYAGLIRVLNAGLEIISTPSTSSKETALNQVIMHIYSSPIIAKARPANFETIVAQWKEIKSKYPNVCKEEIGKIRNHILGNPTSLHRPKDFKGWSIADFLNLLDELGERIIEIIPLVLPDYVKPANFRRLVERIVEYDQDKLDRFLILWKIYSEVIKLDNEEDNKKIVADIAKYKDYAKKDSSDTFRGHKHALKGINRLLQIDVSSAMKSVEAVSGPKDAIIEIEDYKELLTNSTMHSIFIIQPNNTSAVVKKIVSGTSDKKPTVIAENARKEELIDGISEQELQELIGNRSKLEIVADTPDKELQDFVEDRRRKLEWKKFFESEKDLQIITPVDIRDGIGRIMDAVSNEKKSFLVRKRKARVAILRPYIADSEFDQDRVLTSQVLAKNRSILNTIKEGETYWISRGGNIEGVLEPPPIVPDNYTMDREAVLRITENLTVEQFRNAVRIATTLPDIPRTQ